MDKQLIGFNKETGKTHFIGKSSLGVWVWGRQLKNYIFYIADETGINRVFTGGSTNVRDIQRAIDIVFDEPCQG